MKRTTRVTFAALSAVGAIVGAGAALLGTAWVNAGAQSGPQPSVQTTQTASTTLTALQAQEVRLRGLLNSAEASTPAPVIVTGQPQPQPTHASTGASGGTGEEDEYEGETEYEGLDD